MFTNRLQTCHQVCVFLLLFFFCSNFKFLLFHFNILFLLIECYTSIAATSDFNMIKVLENVFIHLNDSWKKNFEKHTIGSLGQVIFFVVPSLEKIDGEDSIKLLIKNITSVHPGNVHS